jgi:hypothetical protein
MIRYIILIFICTGLSIVYAKIASKVIKKNASEKVLAVYSSKVARHSAAEISKPTFPIGVTWRAFKEEVKYRFLPFFILFTILGRVLFNLRQANFKPVNSSSVVNMLLLATIFSTSALFGLVHGGYINILQQGVTALFWTALMFIIFKENFVPEKVAGPKTPMIISTYRLYKALCMAIFVSTICHTAFNLVIYYT